MENIVEVAVKSGKFPTLVTAVKEAGLVEALSSPGELTVFAPSEDAFRAVPKETLENLLKDQEKLGNLLKYHVIKGKYSSSEVAAAVKKSGHVDIATLQGENVKIQKTGVIGKSLKVNDAKIIATDIQASNGVIHVIDKVIMPKKL